MGRRAAAIGREDHRRERRGPGRPSNGDTARCPQCNGTIEFSDRNRGSAVKGGNMVALPAWVCAVCPYAYPVRAEHQPPALRAASRRIRAQAARKLMKARSVRQRAERALEKSLARKRRG